MTQDIVAVRPETPAETPVMRCGDAARMRGEPLAASAAPYRRFLLLEVPGPWGSSALDGKHLDSDTAGRLHRSATDTGTHVMLIRRPGRHPSTGFDRRIKAWAFADTSSGSGRVMWGAWRDPADLLRLDLRAAIPGESNAAGPQRLALVCTHGQRDLCCAVRGRPVAAAIAAATDWDTWECSHLGGHRFAATMMLLPSGDMFGWLDPGSALEVIQRFDAGQCVLAHYRGRAGQSRPVQAALHTAAVRLGDFRRDALHVASARPTGTGLDKADRWEVEVIHSTAHSPGTAYRLIMAGSRPAPGFHSCSDNDPKHELWYETLAFSRVQ